MFSSFRLAQKSRFCASNVLKQRLSMMREEEQVIMDHYCVALTTWFCSPDLGMTSYQTLMRSSGFVVKSKLGEQGGPQYHIVTSSHNVAPWRFPSYYPEDFMKFINEDHVHFTAELRTPAGDMLTACELLPDVFHHEFKDIALLHFVEDAESLNTFQQFKFHMLDIENYQAKEGEELTFYGHRVFDAGTVEDETITWSAPTTVQGNLFNRSEYQTFCSTPGHVLSPGMCGGPVVGIRGSICGMIEGIVPTDHLCDEIKGGPVITEASDILDFIEQVEQHPEKMLLLKGGAVSDEIVGQEALKNPDDYKDPMAFLAKQL